MTNAGRRQGLWFSMHIENEEFIAFITSEVLHHHFDAKKYKKNALQHAYRNNQEKIIGTARRKFLNGAQRPIQITLADFERQNREEVRLIG